MTRNISLLTMLISLLTSAKLTEGSHPYVPLIAMLRSADLVLTARVIRIEQDGDGRKVALAEPYDIVKGQWHQDTLLRLPIKELPRTGIVSSAACEVLYDSGATYLLALNSKEGHLSLAGYPWVARIPVDGNHEAMTDDVRKMMAIDTIEDLPKRAIEYPKLLTSRFSIIRESVVWELGCLDCPEALSGLVAGLRDSTANVFGVAWNSFLLAERQDWFPDSIAVSCAAMGLERDGYEAVQVEAIRVLELRSGRRSFGNVSRASPEQRQKIIGKWKKWYKDWLKGK